MPARIYVALHFGAGDRSRTYTGVSPEDFESSASAIPPLRHHNILGQVSSSGNRGEQNCGRVIDLKLERINISA